MRINPNYFVFQEFVSPLESHTEEGSIPFENKTDKDVQEFGNNLAILKCLYDPSFTSTKAFLHYINASSSSSSMSASRAGQADPPPPHPWRLTKETPPPLDALTSTTISVVHQIHGQTNKAPQRDNMLIQSVYL